MSDRPEDAILAHYDQALGVFGDTPQGARWPNAEDLRVRFDVMLDVIGGRPNESVVLCDLGCGTGELLARIRERGLWNITYIGVDRSRQALDLARVKFPGVTFLEMDVNADGARLELIDCDYLVANGLFTIKHVLSDGQMHEFLRSTVSRVWPHVRRGLAFNVMSKVVDWERDDLFHASMDDMARLLHGLADRRVRMRADYGLYEFTCYAYQPAQTAAAPDASLSRSHDGAVRVLRPLLPAADKVLPYLRRIDQSRIYTNFGPLVLEFEGRLSRHFGVASGGVVTASTGTAGLVAGILATAGRARPHRPLALIPAFTFVATAVAALECGYRPYLLDIDADTWMLDPEALADHPLLDRVGVVMPVAAFGRPVPQAAWKSFRERTGIPVVIDGAAGFEAAALDPGSCLGSIPVVFSLHATKSLGTGEGGCVATTDIGLATLISQALNFGFHSARDSCSASTNGKMSEYHAAVGLAEMDGWPGKQAAFASVVQEYRRQLSAAGLLSRCTLAPDICSSYVLVRCDDPVQAGRLQEALREHGIEFRHWYGRGIHHQTYFADCPSDALPVTDALAPCLLGLPMAVDLEPGEISRVVAAVACGVLES